MSDEQRRRRPPVVHLLFLAYPITGERVLYCNPGSALRINELPERESDEMLEYLLEHQLQPQVQWTNVWADNDLPYGTISGRCTAHSRITARTRSG